MYFEYASYAEIIKTPTITWRNSLDKQATKDNPAYHVCEKRADAEYPYFIGSTSVGLIYIHDTSGEYSEGIMAEVNEILRRIELL